MDGEIIHTAEGAYVQLASLSPPLRPAERITDLLALLYTVNSNCILLRSSQLDAAFLALESGYAGALFLKLNNYRVKTAIVLDQGEKVSQRFQELIDECNRGQAINFFRREEVAIAWLLTP